MDTMKKFAKYALLIIITYILVNLMAYGFIMKSYKNISNYEVLVKEPSIEVIESKATKVNGYVVSKITNNTDSLIHEKYIRINFYNDRNKFVGSKYVELNSFQVDKTLEFKSSYKYSKVSNFTIDITDTKVTEEETNKLIQNDWLSDPLFLRVMTIVGVIMIAWYVL